MSKPDAYARISITLPVTCLHQADRLAQELDRSRSWVIAEALRQFAGGAISPQPSSSARLAEDGNLPPDAATPSPIGPDRWAARLADMALSVEDRVRASESVAAAVDGDSVEQLQLLAFRRAEDYGAWNRRTRTTR